MEQYEKSGPPISKDTTESDHEKLVKLLKRSEDDHRKIQELDKRIAYLEREISRVKGHADQIATHVNTINSRKHRG